MATFSKITPAKSSINSSFIKLFSRDNFLKIKEQVALSLKLKTRERKFDLFEFIMLTIAKFNTDSKVLSNSLSKLHSYYKAKTTSDATITDKCIHKNLDKDLSLKVTEEFTSQVMAFVNKRIDKSIRRSIKNNKLLQLLKQLKINDIVLIDGTEIAASKGAIDNLGLKATTRVRDGAISKPTMKLHIAYSVSKGSFEYVEITDGVDSEKARVYINGFKNTLFIMDAGYLNDDLETKITQSGNYFLIKGKRSMAGFITKCYDSNGHIKPQHHYHKVKELPIHDNLDVDVIKRDKTQIRAVTKFNPNAKANDDKRVILRTNLPRDLISLRGLFAMYKIRWTLEIINKCLKSGCALAPINSTKKNIVVAVFLFSLIAALIKTYIAVNASLNIGFDKISVLKLHLNSIRFTQLIHALIFKEKSAIYQIVKELKEYVCTQCLRSAPSKRDAEQLKDFSIVIEEIMVSIKRSYANA